MVFMSSQKSVRQSAGQHSSSPSIISINTAPACVKKFRSNNGTRCSLVEVPRPVLVAEETWRSTSLQIPVQTFPQLFREQTVNKKVGTNVLLFSINSPHSFRQRIALRKKQTLFPNSGGLQCDKRADRSLQYTAINRRATLL